jgi:hypothetical protein
MSAFQLVKKGRSMPTGNWLSTVVGVVLWFHAAFLAVAELSDIYSIDAILSFTVPILFFGGEVGDADILDKLIWKVRPSEIRQRSGREGRGAGKEWVLPGTGFRL